MKENFEISEKRFAYLQFVQGKPGHPKIRVPFPAISSSLPSAFSPASAGAPRQAMAIPVSKHSRPRERPSMMLPHPWYILFFSFKRVPQKWSCHLTRSVKRGKKFPGRRAFHNGTWWRFKLPDVVTRKQKPRNHSCKRSPIKNCGVLNNNVGMQSRKHVVEHSFPSFSFPGAKQGGRDTFSIPIKQAPLFTFPWPTVAAARNKSLHSWLLFRDRQRM